MKTTENAAAEKRTWDRALASESDAGTQRWTRIEELVEFLKYAGRPVNVDTIIKAMPHMKAGNTRSTLSRAHLSGQIRRAGRGRWEAVALALVLCASQAHAGYFALTPLGDSLVMQAVSGESGGNTFVWSGSFDGGRQKLTGTETLEGQPTVAPALIRCSPKVPRRIAPAKVVEVRRWSCLYRLPNHVGWDGPYDIDTPDGLK